MNMTTRTPSKTKGSQSLSAQPSCRPRFVNTLTTSHSVLGYWRAKNETRFLNGLKYSVTLFFWHVTSRFSFSFSFMTQFVPTLIWLSLVHMMLILYVWALFYRLIYLFIYLFVFLMWKEISQAYRTLFISISFSLFLLFKAGGNGGARRRSGNTGWNRRRKGNVIINNLSTQRSLCLCQSWLIYFCPPTTSLTISSRKQSECLSASSGISKSRCRLPAFSQSERDLNASGRITFRLTHSHTRRKKKRMKEVVLLISHLTVRWLIYFHAFAVVVIGNAGLCWGCVLDERASWLELHKWTSLERSTVNRRRHQSSVS